MQSRELIEEIWNDASNSICQIMQEQNMCNCPNGGCLAAKVGVSEKTLRFYQQRIEANVTAREIAAPPVTP